MKRVYLSLLAIGLVAMLVAAGTTALFTAETANINNTFTAGTVSLDESAFNAVTIDKIVPGDSGSEAFTVQYTGNVPAYLGVKATVDPASTMIGCDAMYPFDAKVLYGATEYAKDGVIHTIGQFVENDIVTLNVDWILPLDAGNGCQGKVYELDLQVFAVQVEHNGDGAADPISWN